jgi:hypothetical protein
MNTKLVVRSVLFLAVGAAAVVISAGSARAAEKAAEGSCGALFDTNVCTSYRMRAGKITELTLRVPVAMIEHAPANAPMAWPPRPDLKVPFAPVVQKQTGFTYASIYWEAHGHTPAAYTVPHFDFHFYFVPERQVEEITCKDTVKPRVLPTGYALPDVNVPQIGELVGLCIPDMGMHAAPDSDLNRKTPWKGSMMVGYYSGKPVFFEPMITTALLLQKHSFSLPIPRGIEPAPHVRYPREFRAVYVPGSNAYDFMFFY